MDSRRQRRRDRAEAGGRWLQRLGMAVATRLPPSTQDSPRCHTYKLSHAGRKAANRGLELRFHTAPTMPAMLRLGSQTNAKLAFEK